MVRTAITDDVEQAASLAEQIEEGQAREAATAWQRYRQILLRSPGKATDEATKALRHEVGAFVPWWRPGLTTER